MRFAKTILPFLAAVLAAGCNNAAVEPVSPILGGGEMHNSNASTPASIDASLNLAQALGFNAVLAPVSWEQTEQEPGKYDFSLVDHLLKAADERDLYLGLLWFGTWKNGESSYTPLWMKGDGETYFRALDEEGKPTTTISPFCEAALKADQKAFSALMAHLKTADRTRRVRVVQVENECGVFLERDCCPAADQAWQEGGWESQKDSLAPQRFMAQAYARYIDAVAEAGKAQYDIPMFTNAWLTPPGKPYGKFPNGGPREPVLDIWKTYAPHLDWLSPDIYSSRLKSLCKIYSDGQPLFIPETYCQIGRLWYAIGEAGARGAFCFGYEEYYNDPYFTAESRVLAEMMPVLSAGHPMHGFIRIDKREDPDGEDTLAFDGYTFNVHYIEGEKYTHGAIVQTGPDEFIVAGVGAWIDWGENCKIAYCEELKDGKVIQVLNGDETAHHNMLYLRGRLCLEDYTSPDGTVIPAPEYGLSSQRRFRSDAQARFKVSGIYRIKLYRYE